MKRTIWVFSILFLGIGMPNSLKAQQTDTIQGVLWFSGYEKYTQIPKDNLYELGPLSVTLDGDKYVGSQSEISDIYLEVDAGGGHYTYGLMRGKCQPLFSISEDMYDAITQLKAGSTFQILAHALVKNKNGGWEEVCMKTAFRVV
jgi:hypothetical protein